MSDTTASASTYDDSEAMDVHMPPPELSWEAVALDIVTSAEPSWEVQTLIAYTDIALGQMHRHWLRERSEYEKKRTELEIALEEELERLEMEGKYLGGEGMEESDLGGEEMKGVDFSGQEKMKEAQKP